MVFYGLLWVLNNLLPPKKLCVIAGLWYDFYDNGTRRDEYTKKKCIFCCYTTPVSRFCLRFFFLPPFIHKIWNNEILPIVFWYATHISFLPWLFAYKITQGLKRQNASCIAQWRISGYWTYIHVPCCMATGSISELSFIVNTEWQIGGSLVFTVVLCVT